MIDLIRLTVDAWISFDGKEAAFSAIDKAGRMWTPILPLPSWSGFRCKRCGISIVRGWRLGAIDGRGKTAYCRGCVELDDPHMNERKRGDRSA